MKRKIYIMLLMAALSVCLYGKTVFAAAPVNGLTGYWTMDNLNFENKAAGVGWSEPIIHKNSMSEANGLAEGSVSFDAKSFTELGIVPNELSKTQQFTLSLWINNAWFSAEQTIFSLEDRNGRQFFSLGTSWVQHLYIKSFGYMPNEKEVTDVVDRYKWYNVTAVVDYSKYNAWHIKLYVNGKLAEEKENWSIGCISMKDCKAFIGADNENGNKPYFGYIDDVRIYNRVLSDVEIEHIYTSLAEKAENYSLFNSAERSGIIGHWTMDNLDFENKTDTVWDNPTIHNETGTIKNEDSPHGKSVWFQGDTYVDLGEIPDELSQTQQFTFSAWINNGWHSADHSIFSIVDSDGRQLFSLGTSWVQHLYISSLGYMPNEKEVIGAVDRYKWYNVTVCVDYSTQNSWKTSLYVNGRLVEEQNDWHIVYTSTKDCHMFIGAYNNKCERPYFGYLDDIRIYNKILSADDIKNMYDNESYPAYIAGAKYIDRQTLDIAVSNVGLNAGDAAVVTVLNFRGNKLFGMKSSPVLIPERESEISVRMDNIKKGTVTKIFVTAGDEFGNLLTEPLIINE